VSEQQDEELLPGPVPGGDARGAEELVGDLLRVLPQDLEPAVEMAVKDMRETPARSQISVIEMS
jgi:hypothetical protein